MPPRRSGPRSLSSCFSNLLCASTLLPVRRVIRGRARSGSAGRPRVADAMGRSPQPPNQLYVLLRHRLLPQPYGFEGFPARGVLVDLYQSPIGRESEGSAELNIGRQPGPPFGAYYMEVTDEPTVRSGSRFLYRH